jgi:hypothetical protein
VAAAAYPCSYEVVRDGAIVSTGHITLDRAPVTGEPIHLGGERLEIDSVWPESGGQHRLRLVPAR